MADLDDLLDEIEQDFKNLAQTKKESSQIQIKQNDNNSRDSVRPCNASMDDDLQFILDDDISPVNSKASSQKSSNQHVKSSQQHIGSKCSAMYLGGSDAIQGQCLPKSKKCCDKLRCTSCDFKVERYKNYCWTREVDYLFLRNNMPDFSKVSRKLNSQEGSCAYACQCTWKSVNRLTPMPGSVRWVCGKH